MIRIRHSQNKIHELQLNKIEQFLKEDCRGKSVVISWISKNNTKRIALITINDDGSFEETYSQKPCSSVAETISANYRESAQGHQKVFKD
jgi:hypothetical protein